MAVTELDSFLSKFKSLWASGHQAELKFNSQKGNVWINLEVGLKCPQPHLGGHQGHGQGNARQRRNIRRAAAQATEVIEKVTEVADEETNEDVPLNVSIASVQEVAATKEHLTNNSSEKRNIELTSKLKLLEEKVKAMEEECESQTNTIAVNDMLHESFKERMRDKYEYNTDDTESDYEPDDEKREKRREESRQKKRLRKAGNKTCDKCYFVGKTDGGLKAHKTKMHKENHSH